MARLIIEGSRSATMRSMAESIVRTWGRVPANVQVTHRQAAQIFLDYVRANVRYRPDPPNSEYMQSAAVSLCAPGTQLCVQVGDCDDLSIALASLCGAYGIPVRILKQMFGSDAQEHVLVAIQDDSGDWLAADPSVPDKPLGWKAPATREDYIDPFDPSTIAAIGGNEAEFIGIGRIGSFPGRLRSARSLVQLVQTGMGRVGVAAAPPPSTVYQLVTDRKIWGGQRYRMGLVANFVSSGGSISLVVDKSKLEAELAIQWNIELLAPTGGATGGVQTWIFQGVAKTDFQLADSVLITYSVVAGEVPASVAGGAVTPPVPQGNVGAAKVAVFAGVIGLAAWWAAPRVMGRRWRAA